MHQFRRITPEMRTVFTKVLLNKGLAGQRMFTSQIIRTVLRVSRVRYLILGSVGAGAVGAKLVCYYFAFSGVYHIYSSKCTYLIFFLQFGQHLLEGGAYLKISYHKDKTF